MIIETDSLRLAFFFWCSAHKRNGVIFCHVLPHGLQCISIFLPRLVIVSKRVERAKGVVFVHCRPKTCYEAYFEQFVVVRRRRRNQNREITPKKLKIFYIYSRETAIERVVLKRFYTKMKRSCIKPQLWPTLGPKSQQISSISHLVYQIWLRLMFFHSQK